MGRQAVRMAARASLLLLVWSSPSAQGEEGQGTAGDVARLEALLLEDMRRENVPGMAVAAVRGDRVVFAKGLGVANIETHAPVTADTLFQVGSVTKSFTAAAVLTLAERGTLDLDKPVGDYVDGLRPRIARLRLRQLLNHTAGLQDEAAEYGEHGESALGEYQRTWGDEYAFLEPGSTFSYSNAGYALAGLAVQEATGKPYADAMKELVFAPLSMNSATFRPTLAMTYPLAVGHQVADRPTVVRPLPNDTRLWPAGTFYASANDMARFALAMLGGGRVEGNAGLSPAVIRRMTTATTDVPGLPNATRYGVGVMLQTRRGLREMGHDGQMTGYTATWRLFPDHRLAVVILCNKDGQRMDTMVDRVREFFVPEVMQADIQPKPIVPMDDEGLRRYVGTYTAPNRFSTEIVVREGRIYLNQFNQETPMTPVGDGVFMVPTPAPREIVFVRDAAGTPIFLQQFYWAFKKVR